MSFIQSSPFDLRSRQQHTKSSSSSISSVGLYGFSESLLQLFFLDKLRWRFSRHIWFLSTSRTVCARTSTSWHALAVQRYVAGAFQPGVCYSRPEEVRLLWRQGTKCRLQLSATEAYDYVRLSGVTNMSKTRAQLIPRSLIT